MGKIFEDSLTTSYVDATIPFSNIVPDFDLTQNVSTKFQNTYFDFQNHTLKKSLTLLYIACKKYDPWNPLSFDALETIPA